jgi:putative endonuclease
MAVHDLAWVCYLLQCADGTLYCGITNNLEKRVDAHNAGEGAKYTRGRTPVKLAYAEDCEDKSAALKRERAIKRLPRADKLALCRAKPSQRAVRQGAGLTKRREKR